MFTESIIHIRYSIGCSRAWYIKGIADMWNSSVAKMIGSRSKDGNRPGQPPHCRRGVLLPAGCFAAGGVFCCRRGVLLPTGCFAADGVFSGMDL